jgi:hypothetical protein
MPLTMKATNPTYWKELEWVDIGLCNRAKVGETDSLATWPHLESSEPVSRGQKLEHQYRISVLVYLVSGDGNAIRPTVTMQQLKSPWSARQPTAVVLAFCHQAHGRWHTRIHGMLDDTRVTIQNSVGAERFVKLTLAWHERAGKDKGHTKRETPRISWNPPNVHYNIHNSPPLVPILRQINPIHCVPTMKQFYYKNITCFVFKTATCFNSCGSSGKKVWRSVVNV